MTGGDANLDNQRKVLVAAMIEGLKIDFGRIIDDALFFRAYKIVSVFSLPCLIIEFYRQDNMPLLRGFDNDVRARRI